jgi:hypothetical protein
MAIVPYIFDRLSVSVEKPKTRIGRINQSTLLSVQHHGQQNGLEETGLAMDGEPVGRLTF